MIRCPKCGDRIEYLCNWRSGEKKDLVSLSGNKKKLVYEQALDFEEDDETNDFECPFCAEVIATSDEEARKLLKGKKSIKMNEVRK